MTRYWPRSSPIFYLHLLPLAVPPPLIDDVPREVDHLGDPFCYFDREVAAEDLVGPLARDAQPIRQFPGCLKVVEGETVRDLIGHRVSKIDTQIALCQAKIATGPPLPRLMEKNT